MNRRIRLVPFIVCAMFSLLVVCMGPVLAMEVGPTPFQRAIASWMGVVALVAEEGVEAQQHDDEDEEDEGEEDEDEDDDEAHHGGERAEWGGRGRRGMNADRGPGSHDPRARGPASRGPGGPPPHMRMEHMQRMRSDSLGRASEIIDRLERIERKLDAAPRATNPWSPRPEAHGRAVPGNGAGPHPMAAAHPEMQERMRTMMQEGRKRMAEAHERMEQARKKFQEMEERIKKLEAEVEQLKAGR
jgi:hypothetical protein